MKLRMYHVIAAVFVVHTYAREEVPPLPAPNPDSVNNFRVALQAVFGVGVRLQAFLLEDKKNENFLVSPISAAVIVGQLILGAEGEFRKQLIDLLALPNIHTYENDVLTYHNQKKNMTFVLPYSTLHIQLSNLLKALESGPDAGKHFILKEKSALFLDHKITLNETFSRGLKRLYEARIHPVDFASDPTGTQKYVPYSKNGTPILPTIFLLQKSQRMGRQKHERTYQNHPCGTPTPYNHFDFRQRHLLQSGMAGALQRHVKPKRALPG